MIQLDTATAGIRGAAHAVPDECLSAFRKVHMEMGFLSGITPAGIVFGQLAHESREFTKTEESMAYSAPRLLVVFPHKFDDLGHAEAVLSKGPKALASHLYDTHPGLGNKRPGDGWRYRGSGYIHLTGLENFERASDACGFNYVKRPDLARKPVHAWRIANWYLQDRKRRGRTLIQLSEAGKVEEVTRGINGGLNGHEDRLRRAELSIKAMQRQEPEAEVVHVRKSRDDVWRAQSLLIDAGYHPGPLDGVMGALTRQALRWFQYDAGLNVDGIAGPRTMAALKKAAKATA